MDKKEPEIKRSLEYDERRKILIVKREWQTDKAKVCHQHTFIDSQIKDSLMSDLMKEKQAYVDKINANDKQISMAEDQITNLELKEVKLSDDEEKVSKAIDKIAQLKQYEKVYSQVTNCQEDTVKLKSYIKDLNKVIEEIKAKARNIKF